MMTASERHSNTPPFKVALVGRRLVDNENLEPAYLVAALDEAGTASERFVLNDASDVGRVADAIRRDDFRLVGLSLPDGGSACLPLALGELLTGRGFRGHITCGGSFATLARHFLLEHYRWLDSVVGKVDPLVSRRAADPYRLPDPLRLTSIYAGERDPRSPRLSPLFGSLQGMPPMDAGMRERL